MKTPHKHAEVIKAWADGAEIQVLHNEAWFDVKTPFWIEEANYRVKPVKRKRYGRLFANDSDGWTGSVWTDSLDRAPILNERERWIGEWVEYEVDGP